MILATRPLLTLSRDRIRDESRLAAAIRLADAQYRKRTLRITLSCLAQYGLGLTVIGLSMRIEGGDLAAVAFYGGMLIALCGPIWTVLLSMWLQENR